MAFHTVINANTLWKNFENFYSFFFVKKIIRLSALIFLLFKMRDTVVNFRCLIICVITHINVRMFMFTKKKVTFIKIKNNN